MGLYRHVVDWGPEMGFAVLACDLPGHGLSSGRAPASTNSMSTVRCFPDCSSRPVGSICHGRGICWARAPAAPLRWIICCIRSRSATRADHPAGAAGSPAAWLRSRISYELVRRFVQQIPRTFSENSSDPGFRVRADPGPAAAGHPAHRLVGALSRWIPRIERAADSAQAPLIVQGEADMTVDWQYNLPVLQRKFGAEVLRRRRHGTTGERARGAAPGLLRFSARAPEIVRTRRSDTPAAAPARRRSCPPPGPHAGLQRGLGNKPCHPRTGRTVRTPPARRRTARDRRRAGYCPDRPRSAGSFADAGCSAGSAPDCHPTGRESSG